MIISVITRPALGLPFDTRSSLYYRVSKMDLFESGRIWSMVLRRVDPLQDTTICDYRLQFLPRSR